MGCGCTSIEEVTDAKEMIEKMEWPQSRKFSATPVLSYSIFSCISIHQIPVFKHITRITWLVSTCKYISMLSSYKLTSSSGDDKLIFESSEAVTVVRTYNLMFLREVQECS